MSSNFKSYSQYYDLLYKDKNYNEEVDYVADLIGKYAPGAKSVVEFGSGTGKHGILLEKKGFDIEGVELSEEMAGIARANGYNCIQGSIVDAKIDKKFDVAISLFHVISYLTDNESLVAAFKNVNAHLKTGGIFVFDVWYSPAVNNLKPQPRIKKIANEDIEVVRFAEPEILTNNNVVNVNYKVLIRSIAGNVWNSFDETHPMRHFTIPEIGILAELTGFKLIHTEEFLSAAPPTENTWGVGFILKKEK